MTKIEPYWNPRKDMTDFRFSIRKEKREGFYDVSDVPPSVLPFFSFVYYCMDYYRNFLNPCYLSSFPPSVTHNYFVIITFFMTGTG